MVLAAVKPLRNRPNPGVETSLVRARPGPEKGVYNGNSGSRPALRRAVVAEGDLVQRKKLQRIEEAGRESRRVTSWAVRRGHPCPGPGAPCCRDTTISRSSQPPWPG